MRVMRFEELMAVLPLLSFGSAASVLSTSTCTHARLLDKVENFKEDPFEGFLNGDSIAAQCESGFEPLNASSRALCVEGVWQIPHDFRCLAEGYCRPLVKPGGSIRVIPTHQRGKDLMNRNIFEDEEHIIVRCNNRLASKNSTYTQSFKCVKGVWEPGIVPQCDHVPCAPPPPLDNGSFILVSEEVAEPVCNGSFQQKGSKSLYCLNGTWIVRSGSDWPTCVRNEVTKTPRTPLEQLQWIALGAGVLILAAGVVLMLFCYLRKDSPKRNRLMHSTSHVDELLHLRRTKPIVIPDPVSHTQVHYTHDRKPIPVTSL